MYNSYCNKNSDSKKVFKKKCYSTIYNWLDFASTILHNHANTSEVIQWGCQDAPMVPN